MKRVDVGRHFMEMYGTDTQEVELRYKEWVDAGFGGDDKCGNYGYLGDRLVKIDY